MANQKKPKSTSRRGARRTSRPAHSTGKAPVRRESSGRRKEMSLTELFRRRKKQDLAEFKPDPQMATMGKTLRLTRLQQLRLAKWGLYVLTITGCLVVQDVIMSQVSIFGATTDLAVCAILLITVIEGTEVGSLFVLLASILYYFSGSAPGAYSIALLTFLGIGATLFRQMFWHRSKGSVILCSAIAVAGYEIGLFIVGLFLELTIFPRLLSFLLTAVFSCLVLIPLYSLIYKIGIIGGITWKE